MSNEDFEGYRPRGPVVIIEPAEVKDKTAGGIIIPEKAREDANYLSNVGKVVALGTTAYVEARDGDNRFGRDKWCTVGDYVAYGKVVGNNFIYKGKKYVVINDDQVLAVVDNPADLNTDYYKFAYRDPSY